MRRRLLPPLKSDRQLLSIRAVLLNRQSFLGRAPNAQNPNGSCPVSWSQISKAPGLHEALYEPTVLNLENCVPREDCLPGVHSEDRIVPWREGTDIILRIRKNLSNRGGSTLVSQTCYMHRQEREMENHFLVEPWPSRAMDVIREDFLEEGYRVGVRERC